MSTLTHDLVRPARHPVDIRVPEALEGRDRLTTAFRPILALPHLLLVERELLALRDDADPRRPGKPAERLSAGFSNKT